jgi:nucleoside-diphosphate-sugar epimerase
MKVLITGYCGYVGPIMVRMFKEAGHSVHGLDVGYFKDCLRPGRNVVSPDNEIHMDLRDITPAPLEGLDVVVHLAALSNDPMGALNPALTFEINHLASINLAKAAKKAGVARFLFASSCSVYGAAGDNLNPLDETAPFNPVSAYAISKVKTEADLQGLADKDFSPVFLRNGTAYGVSPRLRFDLVLNQLMAWARITGNIRVLSDGTPWRPLVHIEDMSRAALAAATAPRDMIHNQAFNIGRMEANYQIRDIAEAVARQIPGSKLEITGETGGDSRSYRVDFGKAIHNLPGFNPVWTLEKGCEELDRWLVEERLSEQSFQSRFFIRLKQLQYLLNEKKVDQDLRFVNDSR